jgi:hypothetical protein
MGPVSIESRDCLLTCPLHPREEVSWRRSRSISAHALIIGCDIERWECFLQGGCQCNGIWMWVWSTQRHAFCQAIAEAEDVKGVGEEHFELLVLPIYSWT